MQAPQVEIVQTDAKTLSCILDFIYMGSYAAKDAKPQDGPGHSEGIGSESEGLAAKSTVDVDTSSSTKQGVDIKFEYLGDQLLKQIDMHLKVFEADRVFGVRGLEEYASVQVGFCLEEMVETCPGEFVEHLTMVADRIYKQIPTVDNETALALRTELVYASMSFFKNEPPIWQLGRTSAQRTAERGFFNQLLVRVPGLARDIVMTYIDDTFPIPADNAKAAPKHDMTDPTYIPAEITKDVFAAQLEDYGVDWNSITKAQKERKAMMQAKRQNIDEYFAKLWVGKYPNPNEWPAEPTGPGEDTNPTH